MIKDRLKDVYLAVTDILDRHEEYKQEEYYNIDVIYADEEMFF